MPSPKAKPRKGRGSPLPFVFRHAERNCTIIDIAANPAMKFGIGWFADIHLDNPKCKRNLLKTHLDHCVENDYGIVFPGDFFCAMQGRGDPRGSKDDIRPEHMRGNYLDKLWKTAADFLEPYAEYIIVLGRGNHETSVLKHHEVDLTELLVEELNRRCGTNILAGGYTGWLRVQFKRGTLRCSRTFFYHHGYGGGGPVTQDMIQGQRLRSWVDGADVILTGHTHDSWASSSRKIALNNSGVPVLQRVVNIKLPTYKEEFADGFAGFHIEKGRPPKPLGCYITKYNWRGDKPILSWECIEE